MDKIIKDIFEDVKSTNCIIQSLVNELQEFQDSNNLTNATAEERTVSNLFDELLDCLEPVTNLVNYYRKPVRKMGLIQKNRNGRYELDDIEFICGSIIEILFDRYRDGREEWMRTHIECAGGKYFAQGYPRDLAGAMVRIR